MRARGTLRYWKAPPSMHDVCDRGAKVPARSSASWMVPTGPSSATAIPSSAGSVSPVVPLTCTCARVSTHTCGRGFYYFVYLPVTATHNLLPHPPVQTRCCQLPCHLSRLSPELRATGTRRTATLWHVWVHYSMCMQHGNEIHFSRLCSPVHWRRLDALHWTNQADSASTLIQTCTCPKLISTRDARQSRHTRPPR